MDRYVVIDSENMSWAYPENEKEQIINHIFDAWDKGEQRDIQIYIGRQELLDEFGIVMGECDGEPIK